MIPGCMLRSGEDVFLDDMHVSELSDALHTPVFVLKSGGDALVRVMCGIFRPEDFDSSHGDYEIKELKFETVPVGAK